MNFRKCILVKNNNETFDKKQGFVEGYSQRLIEGNIVRPKLSRLKVSRLRLHRLRLVAEAHELRLHKLTLYASETGCGVKVK